jgi:hypothetical protein
LVPQISLVSDLKLHGSKTIIKFLSSSLFKDGMNESLTIAMYMIVCAELGEEAVMPTNQRYWEGTEDVSASSSIADLTIFASTRNNCKNQAFNHNNGDYFSWRYMWPR